MARAYQKWTVEEEQKLAQIDDYEIVAKQLQRTVDAVQCRFTKLYIWPRMQEMFYNKDSEIEKETLQLHFDNFIQKYSTFYKIESTDLIRFLAYADKKLRKALNWSPDEEDSDYRSELDEESDNDSDDSDESDNDSDESDNYSDDEQFEKSMQNANKWKLKYHKLKYLNRLKIIDNLMKK